MIRAVADTNILVSALLFGGLPRRWLAAAEAGEFTLVTSLDLLDELDRTLSSRKFKLPPSEINLIRVDMEAFAEVVSPNIRVHAVAADPDDEDTIRRYIDNQQWDDPGENFKITAPTEP